MDNTFKRKNCLVAGTRAEYGLLYGLMEEIKGDPGREIKTWIMPQKKVENSVTI